MFSRAAGFGLAVAALLAAPARGDCPNYAQWSQLQHEPLSTGAYRLSYQRPEPACRTFNSTGVEDIIVRLKDKINDPDLFRLFENTFPNTLDTAIRWRGVAANNTDEELCFVITGDINAMWIRDSANQIAPYRAAMRNKTDDIASVFRGVINLQARYLVVNPYCNAFHPPPESGIPVEVNTAVYRVTPSYDKRFVFTCNFELDDFSAFLQAGHDYYNATGDVDFFGRFQWVHAIQSIVAASRAMQQPTYDADGRWLVPDYTFQSQTMTASGTLKNGGIGNPVNYTGLIRAPFRPSDDAATYDFGIAANMMMAVYLESNAAIMARLPDAPAGLAAEMRALAAEVRAAVQQWGVVTGPAGQKMYAYEVDGFGGQNLMDDANVPSLLSAPFLGFVPRDDPVYRATRAFVLGRANPFWCQGPVLNAVGSPHIRPGAAWPMASIVRVLTSDDDAEIETNIREVLSSTAGLGLVHESVDSFDANRWTRQWFTWANGLFGQMILDLEARKPGLLSQSFQPFRYAAVK